MCNRASWRSIWSRMRQHDRRVLSLYAVCRGYRHRLDRARGRVGQGPGARGRGDPSRPRAAPDALLGLDSDNGSEFINDHLYAYCQGHAITFTRSRAWKRTTTRMSNKRTAPSSVASSAMIASPPRPPMPNWLHVYRIARLHINFFQPVRKLDSKTRVGARARASLWSRANPVATALCRQCVVPSPSTRSRPPSSAPQPARAPPASRSRARTAMASRCPCHPARRRSRPMTQRVSLTALTWPYPDRPHALTAPPGASQRVRSVTVSFERPEPEKQPEL